MFYRSESEARRTMRDISETLKKMPHEDPVSCHYLILGFWRGVALLTLYIFYTLEGNTIPPSLHTFLKDNSL